MSNFFIRACRNSVIIFESVFACDKVYQIRPSVSSAAIIDNRGDTVLSDVLPSPYLSAQVLRIKLVSLSQVSSMFMTLQPSNRSLSNTRAYYCLRTRFLAEFADGCNFFAFKKLSLNSDFKTIRTCFTLTSKFSRSYISLLTLIALSIAQPSLCMCLIVFEIAIFFFSANFAFAFVSSIFSGSSFASVIKSLTSCVVTRNRRATSF